MSMAETCHSMSMEELECYLQI